MGSPEDIEALARQTAHRSSVSRNLLLSVLFITATVSISGIYLLYNADASVLALLVNPFLWPVTSMPFHAFSTNNITTFDKPKDVKIRAVVGYRNPARTAILDCYLQNNLVDNGGLIDEVIFRPETTEAGHLEWLHGLANRSDLYSVSAADDLTYSSQDLYLQIDGDVVFIEEHTIPTMVHTKLQHPDALVVSANVVHQPAVSKFHSRAGVIVPSSSELYPARKQLGNMSDGEKSNQTVHSLFWSILPQRMRELFEQHKNNDNINTTEPPVAAESDPAAVRAQQHYSFLHHLIQGTLGVYKFPSWTNPPDDVSPAFTCVRGGDIPLIHEKQGTAWLRKRTIIDGKGVVSHYNSEAEGDRELSDIVQRYQSFAEEKVCASGVWSLI